MFITQNMEFEDLSVDFEKTVFFHYFLSIVNIIINSTIKASDIIISITMTA